MIVMTRRATIARAIHLMTIDAALLTHRVKAAGEFVWVESIVVGSNVRLRIDLVTVLTVGQFGLDKVRAMRESSEFSLV